MNKNLIAKELLKIANLLIESDDKTKENYFKSNKEVENILDYIFKENKDIDKNIKKLWNLNPNDEIKVEENLKDVEKTFNDYQFKLNKFMHTPVIKYK